MSRKDDREEAGVGLKESLAGTVHGRFQPSQTCTAEDQIQTFPASIHTSVKHLENVGSRQMLAGVQAGGGANMWQSWKHLYATKCLAG